MFNDWTSDYSKTPNYWKPALTEADRKKERNEILRDQLGKGYYWTPDKSTEIAYNVGGFTGQVTQAVTIGKVLSVAGVGGQLATWGQKATLFGSTGAVSGAINAYGEGKDTTGIIQESAISGTVSIPLGFAGEYVGNQIGKAVQKIAPLFKNFARNIEGASKTGTETFYRTMSKADYETFVKTGKVPATSETFISPTQSFSEGYNGVTVEFKVKAGTTNELASVGVRDSSGVVRDAYGNMPPVSKGWKPNNAYFKGEDGQINIGLGKGTALDIFNNSIVESKVVGGR
jgi:hypothetical protein